MINWIKRPQLWATVVIVMLLVACGGAEERKAKYMSRAKAFFAEENYGKANVEFKNVLQIDPKSSEAWYYLGLIIESGEDWDFRRAFTSFARAVEYDPEMADAHRKLGKYYAIAGNLKRAREESNWILGKFPDDADGLVILASIQLREGDTEKAIITTKKVFTKDPSNVDAAQLLANIYRGQSRFSDAARVMEKATQVDTENMAMQLRLAQIYAEDKKTEEAIAVMKGLIENHPDRLGFRIALASYYGQLKQDDAGEQVLREAIDADPKAIERHLLLSEFLLPRGGTEAVEKQLSAAVKQHPELTALKFSLARLYETTERGKEAEEIYQLIAKNKDEEPERLAAMGRIAELERKQGNIEAAEALADSILKENPSDFQATLVKGKIALARQEYKQAIILFRDLLREQPKSAEILTYLATAHRFNGDISLASETMRKAVDVQPEVIPARLSLMELMFASGNLDEALEQANAVLKMEPDNFIALIGKSDILARGDDMEALESVISRLKIIRPDDPNGAVRMGRLRMVQKRYKEAVKEFELVMKLAPEEPAAISDIVGAEMAMGDLSVPVSRLRKMLDKNPKNDVARGLLAITYEAQGEYDAAEKEYLKQIELTPETHSLYAVLANFYHRRGEIAHVEQAYLNGLESGPKAYVPLRLALAFFYEGQGNFDQTEKLYKEVLQKEPDNLIALNNLAAFLTDRRGDANSLKRALKLASVFADSKEPALVDTLGWVHYKLGAYDEAILHLARAVEIAPEIPIFQYHLGMAHYGSGNKMAAKSHLSKAVSTETKYSEKEDARKALRELQ